jgi:predicted dehydrogenase
MNSHLNRREFLKKSSTGALGLAFFPGLLRKVAPSDKLRVAHIGLGGMGTQHLKWFASLPEVEIVGLCDLDQEHLGTALKTLQGLHPDTKAKTYKDFRKVLENKDIDAITCATPDHWHAQIAIMAFQAGKDVYGEKPLSYDIKEGQEMLKNLKQYNRIFQMGNQIHASDNYHRVVELIQSGVIGNVHTVRLWKTGNPPDLGPAKVQKPPKTLDWDMWLGPAPYVDYIPQRCHFTYRYFLDYSGGVFADFWCHIADIVYWSIGPKGLKSVSSKGEKAPGIADVPNWLDIEYAFDGLNLYWTSQPPDVPGAAKRGIGAYFEGDKGTLLCDYGTREISLNGISDVPAITKTIPRSPGHQQNFVDAVKARTQPESHLAYAREMTLPMHLGLISYRLGRKLNWNSTDERFVDDKEADAFISREYRKKWKLV